MFGLYASDVRGEQEMSRMLGALSPRGPDGMAAHIDAHRQVAMGMCLLRTSPDDSTTDLILANEDRTLLAVCDGQVFNRDEVMRWLRQRGHALGVGAPGEILVHLIEEEGLRGLRRLDAQFAFALWDQRHRRLLLGRDPLGVRSLYFYASSQGVLFASELKALLAHSQAPCAVDPIGVSHYLTFLTVPAPRTLLEGMKKLPPGTVAICQPDGTVELERYWDLLDDPIAERDDESFYVQRVRELHEAAVRRRAVAGPLGALLSGGNDSSANVMLLSRLGCAPLHTFTVGLKDTEGQAQYNDLLYAKQVANLSGSRHHEALLSVDEFIETIPRTVEAMDDMVSEPSSVFLYHALRMARSEGLKVVITGEANDELSCGHGEMIRIRNHYYRRWRPFMKLPHWVRQGAAAVAPLISPRRADILRRAADGEEYFWNFEVAWMESEKADALTASAWERCRRQPASEVVRALAERVQRSDHGRRDYLNYIIYVMMQDHYFGNLMLGKLDLLSANLGIEARCPYTEPTYAHFVYNIPARFKFRGGTVKSFFKRAIAGLLPDDIIYRPKQGFRTPVVEMFQGRLGDWARPILLGGGLTEAGVLRQEHLAQLLRDHREGRRDYSNRLWTAMALNLWHDRWARREQRVEVPVPPLRRMERDGATALLSP
ncbi:MAG: asparagine synthase (glutamine-hydrolyzing) [Myxococcales bacterium]|nr:asparagine synthase (glutamine-hydrolyzing) [Myxococcota bacterium]MDW8283617.1 asparagine synthase (glutamine-hydrolyzing) [Myxococcales bacterium]